MKINCSYKKLLPQEYESLILKEIPGFSKYLASCDGRIFSKLTKKQIQQKFRKDRYINVLVSPDIGPKYTLQLEHRLICMAFYGKSNLHVNHKDGNRANNKPSNLEWCTRSENIRHSIDVLKNDHSGRGLFANASKLNKEQHIQLNKFYKNNVLELKELAKFYNVCEATVTYHIRNSKRLLKSKRGFA